MFFWVAAACLTVLCVAATLYPLLKKPEAAEFARNHDLEVYKDQLAELKRDAESGLIAAADAESARIEISRRILAGADGAMPQTMGGNRLRGVAALTMAALVPVLSWGGYALVGSPAIPDQPIAARANNPDGPIQDVIAQAEAHLAKNPDDGRGWDVLGPIYVRLGRIDEAEKAYRRSIELNGESAERLSGLAEALIGKAEGNIDSSVKSVLSRALSLNPDEPKARILMAVSMARDRKPEEARANLEDLLAKAPPDARWAPAVRNMLENLAPSQSAGKVATGPSKDQVEAAEGMSGGDRRAMIESMVAGLAEKLKQNPDDLEGWQRLIRSYVVLQKRDEAAKAFADAQASFKEDEGKLASIRTFAKELGLNGG